MYKLINFILWLLFWYNQTCVFKIYASQDVYLYSINQSESSGNTLIPDKTPNFDELKLWHNQSYGDLVMSHRASKREKLPVWKSIDKHLKDIDLYVAAMENVFSDDVPHWSINEVKSGASGILVLYNGTSNSDEKQLMYSWDTEHNRTVTIPKFVYKFIAASCSYPHTVGPGTYLQCHNAVIVIHNDPTTGSDGDRFDCESCSGWYEIEDTQPEDGLTYVCHLNEEMSKILGIEDDYNPESAPLNLDSMDYTYCENWDWTSLTAPRLPSSQTGIIYEQYLRLKESD